MDGWIITMSLIIGVFFITFVVSLFYELFHHRKKSQTASKTTTKLVK